MITIKKWLKRIGKTLLALIVVGLIAGVIYEQVSRKKIKKYEASRTGNFVDVGGHHLYYYSKGKGKPTVVFESGFPGNHMSWSYSELFNEVSEFTTAVCYNRAGILYSERGKEPKNSENISKDLYALLQNGGFEKPYILVGHSAAGIYLRPFIEKHEKDILGVILLDPSHPDQTYAANEDIKEFLQPPFIPPKWLLNFGNNTGVVRLLTGDQFIFYSIKSSAISDGISYLAEECSKRSDKTSFGEVPLVIISAGLESRIDELIQDKEIREKMLRYWDSLQVDIANSSKNGRRIISEKSTHNNIMKLEKEIIIKEIRNMIKNQDSTDLKK